MNAREARSYGQLALSEAAERSGDECATPTLDCDLLLARAIGSDRAYAIAHPERTLTPSEEATFIASIRSRAEGLPVAYITGVKEFWSLPFLVNQSVLIPKPDTETLVERALAVLSQSEGPAVPINPAVRVLDVCTGSGCVAIALKHDIPALDITATDVSADALAVARENAIRILGPAHDIRFVEGNLRAGLPPPREGTEYDLIVSNPPYVPSKTARDLLLDGRGEPLLALDGGDDGLDLARSLADAALPVLRRGGKLLMEAGEYNAKDAAGYLSTRGFVAIVIHRDLSGQERIVEGSRP